LARSSRVLAQPIYRDALLIGKFPGCFLVLLIWPQLAGPVAAMVLVFTFAMSRFSGGRSGLDLLIVAACLTVDADRQ
jgi:ABC-type transport system involved in multi-copper enzyme maturation permease subunit